jgi:threonine/homoserine/homoserine lactone efflux protein
VAVVFGLGVLLQKSVVAFSAVKLIGAVYLVFLGIQQFRHRKDLAVVVTAAPKTKKSSVILREGLVVGVTNPKGLLIFTAVLPQFVSRGHGSVALQLLLLGLICVAVAVVSDCAWGLLAGTARVWFQRSPRLLELIGAASGIVLVGLGGYLALTG